MIDLTKTAAPSLPEMVALIEGDAVRWLWSVGRCPCESEEGEFSARVQSPDYEAPVQGLNLLTGRVVTVQEGRGCDIFAHGASPEAALARAYGIAVGRAG